MARYTLNLSEVCEQLTGIRFEDVEGIAFDRIDTIANAAIPHLFSDRIDVFDNGDDMVDLYRRIIEHYWEYEVCTYTPSDFILRINRKLNEIMPYYNQRYETTKLEYPVFEDINYDSWGTEQSTDTQDDNKTSNVTNSGTDVVLDEHRGKDNTKSQESGTTKRKVDTTDEDQGHKSTLNHQNFGIDLEGSSEGAKTDWHYQNDTPQGSISGIKEEDYLTSYNKDTSDKAEIESPKTDDLTYKGFNIIGDGNVEMSMASHQLYKSYKNVGEKQTDHAGSELAQSTGKQKIDTNDDVTHGKGVNTDYNYNSDRTTTTRYGHIIDSTGSLDRDMTHEGSDHKHLQGKQNMNRTYAEMLNSYRTSLINIYMEVIDELRELFFLIY